MFLQLWHEGSSREALMNECWSDVW